MYYDELIDSSTEEFASKHLLLHYPSRRRLMSICDYELGPDFQAFVHVPACFSDDLYHALHYACQGLARRRLNSILDQGCFESGELINTLIVSTRPRIFLHMQRSYRPGCDLWLKIEEKRSIEAMRDHFSFNDNNQIDHYIR